MGKLVLQDFPVFLLDHILTLRDFLLQRKHSLPVLILALCLLQAYFEISFQLADRLLILRLHQVDLLL